MQATDAACPQGIKPAGASAASRRAAPRRPALPGSRQLRPTVARAGGGEPDEALQSIDQGPGKASPSFQDMRNAQESYSEVPRHSVDLEGGAGGQGSEKDAPETAPESGTVRETSSAQEGKEGGAGGKEGEGHNPPLEGGEMPGGGVVGA